MQIIPKLITIMGWFVLIQLEFQKCWDVFLDLNKMKTKII